MAAFPGVRLRAAVSVLLRTVHLAFLQTLEGLRSPCRRRGWEEAKVSRGKTDNICRLKNMS
jgi:hypothetical protein